MSLETASFIHQLNPANPASADRLQQGDDHIRMVKAALRATFPNLTGAMTLDQTFLNGLSSSMIPVGFMGPFYGSSAPTGWAICNGQTVPRSDGVGTITTPDLRGLVVAGVADGQGVGQTRGQTSRTVTSEAGGAHNHVGATNAQGRHNHGTKTGSTSLTVAQMPSHRHFGVAAGVSNADVTAATYLGQLKTAEGDSNYRLTGVSAEPALAPTSSSGNGQGHDHGIADDGEHSHAVSIEAVPGHAHAVSVDVTQPTMALHYIMKI